MLLIVIPGPDTAMVTKNAVVGGRRSGVYAALGVALGLTIWTAAAALGIAALLRASSVAFDALKIAGAIYLTWVGIQMLRSRGVVAEPHGPADERARGRCGRACSAISATRRSPCSSRASCRSSCTGDAQAFVPLLFLGGVFAVLTLFWLAAYALAVGHASGWLRRPSVRKALDRVHRASC